MHGRAWDADIEGSERESCNGNCLRKYYWWNPPENSLEFDYFRNSSLHGLKYIGQNDKHLLERIFWLVSFISGTVVAFYFILDVFRKYQTSPVIVSFQPTETQIDEIPFPAVTICNMNKVLKSKAMTYIRAAESQGSGKVDKQALKDYYYLNHVCAAQSSFTTRFNPATTNGTPTLVLDEDDSIDIEYANLSGHRAEVQEFLSKASQPCGDMLEYCIWQEDPINCVEIFKPIETDFGKCCTFNLIPPTLLDTFKNDSRDDPVEVHQWAKWNVKKNGIFLNEEYQFKFPRRQIRAGKSYGLSFLLNPNLDEYFCTASDSKGFRMVANLPIEFPQVVDFGVAVGPMMEVFVGIRPEIVMSESSIAGFALDKRECYFNGEYPLNYYNYYTASNCVNECIANETFERCQCVTYYMPRDDTRPLCNAEKFSCANSAKREFTKGGKKSRCAHCLPACTEIRYLLEVTSTPTEENQTYSWPARMKNSSSWNAKNASVVHVYFAQDATYARVRKELYGITDLIASTGGLMGLCLGFSGLSLVEILYYVTLRACCRAYKRKQSGHSALHEAMSRMEWWKSAKAENRSYTPDLNSSANIHPSYLLELRPKLRALLPIMAVGSKRQMNTLTSELPR